MRSVNVPAGVIEYDQSGSGPPVVLLHELLMDHMLWDRVIPLLPEGFRYLRPVLPLGAHRRAMNPGADLTLPGRVRLVAGLLGAEPAGRDARRCPGIRPSRRSRGQVLSIMAFTGPDERLHSLPAVRAGRPPREAVGGDPDGSAVGFGQADAGW